MEEGHNDGVYLTLYSQLTKTSQIFKDSEDNATVDAHGMYFGMAAILLYIGVGFVVAYSKSLGNAKAFVGGISR